MEAAPTKEKENLNQGNLFAVSPANTKPLLDMPSVAASAKTFHKYANDTTVWAQDKTMPLSDYFRILWELSVALQDETIHLSS